MADTDDIREDDKYLTTREFRAFEKVNEAQHRELGSKIEVQHRELNTKMDAQYRELDTKIDAHYQELNTKIDAHYQELNTKMDAHYQELNSRIEHLTRLVYALMGFMGVQTIALIGVLMR